MVRGELNNDHGSPANFDRDVSPSSPKGHALNKSPSYGKD